MPATQSVSLRLSSDERTALKELAERNEISVNQLLKMLVRAAVAPGAPATKQDMTELAQARQALDACGRNLNQVARALNQGKVQNVVIDDALLTDAIEKTQGVAKAIGRLISTHRERTAHAIGAEK